MKIPSHWRSEAAARILLDAEDDRVSTVEAQQYVPIPGLDNTPGLELSPSDPTFRFTCRQATLLANAARFGVSTRIPCRKLTFSGFDLSSEAARTIASHRGPAYLENIKYLPSDTAYHLSKHKGTLILDGILDLSEEACSILSHHEGLISLNGIKDISCTAFSALLHQRASLSLQGIRELSTPCCEIVHQHFCHENVRKESVHKKVDLCNLEEISDESTALFIDVDSNLVNLTGLVNAYSRASAISTRRLELLDSLVDIRYGVFRLNGLRTINENIVNVLNRQNTFVEPVSEWDDECRTYCRDVELNGIDYLTDEDASKISRIQGKVTLNGLSDISPSAAEILAASEGSFVLDSLKSLTSDVAQGLSSASYLSLRGLSEISDFSLSILLSRSARLNISGLKLLPKEVAALIAKNPNRFGWSEPETTYSEDSIPTLFEVRDLAPESISEFNSRGLDLSVPKLTEISEDVAKSLHFAGYLEFQGVRRISIAVAEILAERDGVFQHFPNNVDRKILIPNLEHLPSEVADCLGPYWPRDLSLNNLRELSSGSAKAISRHEGSVSLNGLKHVSSLAAEMLGMHNGDLALDGLEDITPSVAKGLAKHRGRLSLNGIKCLSPESIGEFQGFEGCLSVAGITDLHPEVAAALSEANIRSAFPRLLGVPDSLECLFAEDQIRENITLILDESNAHSDSRDLEKMIQVVLRRLEAKASQLIIFGGVEHLEPAAINELSKCRAGMMLRCVRRGVYSCA